jgi:hypothetical protein
LIKKVRGRAGTIRAHGTFDKVEPPVRDQSSLHFREL